MRTTTVKMRVDCDHCNRSYEATTNASSNQEIVDALKAIGWIVEWCHDSCPACNNKPKETPSA